MATGYLAQGTQSASTPAESYEDFGTSPEGKCAYWKAEISACEKDEAVKKWRSRAESVVKRYRDERDDLATGVKKYNMLWSIVNTTMPAIYGKPPTPIVMRRYTDPDQVARVASMMLERTLAFQLSFQSEFHPTIRSALQDRLLPGMGCAWVRYQKAQASPTGTLDNAYYADFSGSVAAVDFVYWEDFGFVPSRTWEEVPAVWRAVYMTKDELVKRFPDKHEVPLDYVPARHPNASEAQKETDEPKNAVFKQAKVYEIWDKRTSKVCWVSMSYDTLLDEKDDPTNFPGFFPCPKPLFATNTTGNLVPVPDYIMYRDQAAEIDNLTQRLNMLTKALKVIGLYDGSQDGIKQMLEDHRENELIPVDTWAAFAEKGGLKGTVDWLPLETIIEVVDRLFNIRQQLIQDIYQITGLSDIIRGASNPNETLGAQKIKAQFASVRLDALKQDLARFVTDILRLMGHIVIEFFDDKTIIEQSAIMQSPDGQKAIKDAQAAMAARMAAMQQQAGPPPPPAAPPMGGMLPAAPPAAQAPPPANVVPFPQPGAPTGPQGVVQQALQLLKQGRLADYRIEVASNTMIEPDLETERAARNEFITGITQFLQAALPAVQANPQMLPIAQSLMLFGIRGFRVGRDIEGVIEAAFEDMKSNPQPQPPDPKLQAVQAKAQSDKEAQQADTQAMFAKMQMEQKQAQEEMGMEMQKMQAEMQLEREKAAAELQAMREKTQAEVEAILIKANVQAEVARNKQAADAQAKSQEVEDDVAARAAEMDMKSAEHEQSMEHQAETNQSELDMQHEQNEMAKEKKGEGE